MRNILVVLAIAFLASQTFAAPRSRGEGEMVPGAPWVKRAHVTSLATAVAEAAFAEASGNRPIALLETNYYTFLPNDELQLRVTLHPNGFTGAATVYLYRENRTTGQRGYYNIAGGGMLAAGQTADLFGAIGSPVPIVLPQLSDFVLFGSAGDAAALSWGVDGALGASTTVPTGQTGLYQWVVEIRDAAGKRVISRSNAMYSYIEESVAVTGTMTSSTTWTANKRYVLNDFVGVAAPAVLTIEPGTVIYGGTSTATLFIHRGAKIMANGTTRRPIIFTSP
ncbi:MAG TPA: hypothetical protein VIL97_01290, partial [Thermoanaerobaculia bacterium]